MPFKIVRNDITKMNTDAIVNTANPGCIVGAGCDTAVYNAAGREKLLAYRQENIGERKEGEVFLTPGFDLQAKYIIHAVSPLYLGGENGEEEKLRACYRGSLRLAAEQGLQSIAFPLISTGEYSYPKEEAMRIAADEITAFLMTSGMLVYLVVFDDVSAGLGGRLYPDLESYIDRNYVEQGFDREYGYSQAEADAGHLYAPHPVGSMPVPNMSMPPMQASARECVESRPQPKEKKKFSFRLPLSSSKKAEGAGLAMPRPEAEPVEYKDADFDFEEEHESKLNERMKHLSDTFSQYLLYLIQDKGMENAEVYKRAIVDKKIFSKIKNNPEYHPQKLTALCLCVGAMLNLDETKDLLARAGYALSPCDKTDIIFSYFIENEIYDMIELDIQLEEHDLPCIIQ